MKTIYVRTYSLLRGEPVPIGVQQLPDTKADELLAANRASYVYLDALPNFNDLHISRRAWVLGCGPSLREITADQWACIDKDVTIGVNDVPAVHDVKFLLFLDGGLEEQFECIRTSKAKFKFTHLGQKVSIPAIGVMRSTVPTERIEDGLYWNGSSVHAGVNLALVMGCNPIVLLGVDYRDNSHAAARTTDNPDLPYGKEHAVRNFARLAELAGKHGTTIVNANPDSAVQCFAKTSLAQLLRPSPSRSRTRRKTTAKKARKRSST
ncbi:MAG: hypothetical protein GWP14_08855 [Actinobacteria bacterium]|nr:hypothetical protein [Actinomycetota bacterium]